MQTKQQQRMTYTNMRGLTLESLALLEGVRLMHFHNSCLLSAFVKLKLLLAESVA